MGFEDGDDAFWVVVVMVVTSSGWLVVEGALELVGCEGEKGVKGGLGDKTVI